MVLKTAFKLIAPVVIAIEIMTLMCITPHAATYVQMRANDNRPVIDIDSGPDIADWVELPIVPGIDKTTLERIEENEAYNPYQRVAESMTDDEAEVLRRILWAEANNQSLEGQIAVVEVIFNRVISSDWPDTVYGVLSQSGQFSTWKARNSVQITPGQLQDDAIAECIARGPSVLPSVEYVYFARKKHSWMHDSVKIGGHWFGR